MTDSCGACMILGVAVFFAGALTVRIIERLVRDWQDWRRR